MKPLRPAGLALVIAFWIQPSAAADFDLLVRGGLVYDGSGGAPMRADLAVTGDRIVRVGGIAPAATAKRVIDARALAVAPGFIDLHAHLEPLHRMPAGESAVRQGVTTALGGPDGTSPWPIGDHLRETDRLPLGLNVAYLVGHNTIRRMVLKMADRAPSPAELTRMQRMVEQAMHEGAFGISTGLKYLPGAFSKLDELVALSAVAGKLGGIYTSHLREEGLGLIEAVDEAIAIGRRARIPVVLTHHKVVGQQMWGASERTLAMVEAARAAGTDVMLDQYPYTASYTNITVLLPAWARAGGDEAFARRCADPVERARIRAEVEQAILTDRGGGDLRRIQFSIVKWQPDLTGRTLHDWCVERGLAPTFANGAELVLEAALKGGSGCVFHAMDEADVERIMRHPQTMIASDGRLSRPGEDQPHPRNYGTFPRVLGRYVRERNVLTLESAVHKMTLQPAQRLGLRDRGRIAVGWPADLVVFDPATVRDRATFEQPHQYPEGIPYVIVNGTVTVDEGRFTAARAGRALRGPAVQPIPPPAARAPAAGGSR
jgi:N-acyl-D-amino-acid deacylase